MKMKLNYFFILFGLVAMTSCGSADEGEKVANQFFELIAAEKFDTAAELIEVNPGVTVDERVEMAQSLGFHSSFGKLKLAKKSMGFNTNISNGITTVVLTYRLKFENGEYVSSVTIIDRGEGFKISTVE